MSSPDLRLYRSDRVEDLAAHLVRNLASDLPADPILPQEVVVGSRGMERWLRHRIATLAPRGVCANIAFPFQEEALARRIALALGDAAPPAPDLDPYAPERLAFTVLTIFAERQGDPRYAEIHGWLADDPTPAGTLGPRAWSLATAIADILDRLTRYRADLLAPGQPLTLPGAPDWLPDLWDTLVARLGPHHFAARLHALGTCRDLQPTPTLRIFGVSALPRFTLQALRILAQRSRVEVYAFVPSLLWWADDLRRPKRLAVVRSPDDAALQAELRQLFEAQNPLLTSLGRVSRDFQALVESEWPIYDESEPTPEPTPPATLLARVQRSIRDAAALPPRIPFAQGDRSLQIHACFGALRQVELLRDRLLDLFDRHALHPRDVLVMTPDLATFAPLIDVIFRAGTPAIPVVISDLGLRQLNLVADALLRILALADARLTLSGVLDLLTLGPVRDRFELSAADVESLRTWLHEAGFRWARDASDRQSHGLPADDAYTLQMALSRLALGVVMADDPQRWTPDTPAPLDAIEGHDVLRLGRALHYLRSLEAACARLAGTRTATLWVEALRTTLDALTLTSDAASFLTGQVHQTLSALGDAAATFETPLSLGAVRRYLEGRFESPARGDRPIDGSVTVSTLRPMRSVPYPVIALIGMDDGVFPRSAPQLGFDPLARAPRIGDRSLRDEDRHLFLEALLSARDHLLITYTGHDERTREARPPCGPVADLRDALDRPAEPPLGGDGAGEGDDAAEATVLAHITEHHPLQPFSRAAFSAANDGAPRSYDAGAYRVATRLSDPRRTSPRLFSELTEGQAHLPEAACPERVTLTELIKCLRNPCSYLLQQRLGLYLPRDEDALSDREPIEVGGLDKWTLSASALDFAHQRELPPSEAPPPLLSQWLAAKGLLPPGGFGEKALQGIWSAITPPLVAFREEAQLPLSAGTVDLAIDGVRLTGKVADIDASGAIYRLVHDDPTKPRHLLTAWVNLLAAAAAGLASRVVILGERAGPKSVLPCLVATFRAPPDPLAALADLLALWREARRRPLPLAEKSSHAFASALHKDKVRGEPPNRTLAADRAERAWESTHFKPGGDEADPALKAIFGELGPHRLDADDDAPCPDFAALAQRVWDPILDAMHKAEQLAKEGAR